jgi:hypothetical protein
MVIYTFKYLLNKGYKMENLKEVLEFDGLYEAEKLTGKSYKTDKLND